MMRDLLLTWLKFRINSLTRFWHWSNTWIAWDIVAITVSAAAPAATVVTPTTVSAAAPAASSLVPINIKNWKALKIFILLLSSSGLDCHQLRAMSLFNYPLALGVSHRFFHCYKHIIINFYLITQLQVAKTLLDSHQLLVLKFLSYALFVTFYFIFMVKRRWRYSLVTGGL